MTMTNLPSMRRCLLAAMAALVATLAACKKPQQAPAAPDTGALSFGRPDVSVMAHTVVPLALNGVFVAGSVFDDAGPSSWGWVAKVDSEGHRVWEKDFGKKARSAYFSAGMLTEKENVLLAGTVNQGNANDDPASGWLLALTPDGRVLWEQAPDFGQQTHALVILPAKEDSYLVMGSVRDRDRKDRAWVLEVDGAGRQSLHKLLDSPDSFIPDALARLEDGSFLVAGKVFVDPQQTMRGWIGRFGAGGKPQWSRTLDLEQSNVAAAGVASDGNIVMAVDGGRDGAVRLLRMDASGKTLGKPGVVALCGKPTLWWTQEGQMQLGGLPCPSDGLAAASIVVIPDLEHPERVQRIAAAPGTRITGIVGRPEESEIDLLGERRGQDTDAAVFDRRPMPESPQPAR